MTLNVAINIPDPKYDERMLDLEGSIYRSRNSGNGNPTQTDEKWVEEIFKNWIRGKMKSGQKKRHLEEYEATYEPVEDTDVT